MSGQTQQIVEGLGYVVAGRIVLHYMKGAWREVAFALLNIAALYLFFFTGKDSRLLPTFFMYLALVVGQYTMLRAFVARPTWRPWMAFLSPLLVLVSIRYLLPVAEAEPGGFMPYGPMFVGISYLAFRASHLVLEVRNGMVPIPGFFEYLGFCFFAPTLSVGPINPFSNHRRGFDSKRALIPASRAALRILVGLVKYKFLGSVCFQLSYANLLADDHFHHWIDLPVAILFYYLFLYCNFSGFCDAAIGVAGLIGIPVAENFDNPLASRNVKDFWNRWHMTLSIYMRDVLFSPLSKYLVRLSGPAYVNHAVALTIVVVFLLVGIWHGVGWNYAAFGAVHALGVVTNHYYTIGLKKWLGRDRFKAYNENPWLHAAAVVVTFCYCAASLFFFANTFLEMKQIFSILR
jgi:D-alanyl-lipoteichoic acid acyltransferase DltB (MBOAT superfamily)